MNTLFQIFCYEMFYAPYCAAVCINGCYFFAIKCYNSFTEVNILLTNPFNTCTVESKSCFGALCITVCNRFAVRKCPSITVNDIAILCRNFYPFNFFRVIGITSSPSTTRNSATLMCASFPLSAHVCTPTKRTSFAFTGSNSTSFQLPSV